MKAPILHTDADGELRLNQLTVGECIEMADLIWQREHHHLLARLDEAKADPADRLKALKDHDDVRGLASELTRQCFRLPNALAVLEKASDDASRDRIEKLAPDIVINLSLKALGYVDREDDADRPQTAVVNSR